MCDQCVGELEEWDDGMNANGEKDMTNFTILPGLRSLNILVCLKLKLETLPNYLLQKISEFQGCLTKEERREKAKQILHL